jgi:hypothetical protein
VPSLFKRQSGSSVSEVEAAVVETQSERASRARTEKKGKATPKRTVVRRRPEPPPANRREAMKKVREKARQDRAERRAAMMAGDERYLLPRDQGPEKALARDIVDRRPTIGTWFFGGALLVLLGSNRSMPQIVQVTSNLLWALLALATLVDSILLAREIGRKVRERHPKTDKKMMNLYVYGAMRGLTFRRMRIPKPRVKFGAQV